jgi:ElaB/YqjD/DUF883 family membrane-anchored ribosome-binding protein
MRDDERKRPFDEDPDDELENLFDDLERMMSRSTTPSQRRRKKRRTSRR